MSVFFYEFVRRKARRFGFFLYRNRIFFSLAVVAYTAPAAYPYAYSAYPYAGYPAVSAYSAYAAYPSYPAYGYDDGKYWPGKYDKTYYPAPAVYKSAAYPIAYHY